jgi:hypothetical protein
MTVGAGTNTGIGMVPTCCWQEIPPSSRDAFRIDLLSWVVFSARGRQTLHRFSRTQVSEKLDKVKIALEYFTRPHSPGVTFQPQAGHDRTWSDTREIAILCFRVARVPGGARAILNATVIASRGNAPEIHGRGKRTTMDAHYTMMDVNVPLDNLAESILTKEGFPDLYRKISAMRFPIAVEEVWELRDLLNHSADRYDEPTTTPQFRDFRESLLVAIHSFGIDSKRHCERLIKIFSMLRDLHYQHSVASRDLEEKLRMEQSNNRRARARSVRYGLYALLATATFAAVWAGIPEPAWWLKLLTAGSAFLAWDYHHSLPALDREMARIAAQLSQVHKNRIDSLNWKMLIHKLSLILGFKQIRGVEVYRHNHGGDGARSPRTYH